MYKQQQGQHSFFGNFLYERAVSKNHFLSQLSQVVDLAFIDEICKDLYHQAGAGQRPYAPSFLFKEGVTKANYVQKLTTDPDAARGHKSANQSLLWVQASLGKDWDGDY